MSQQDDDRFRLAPLGLGVLLAARVALRRWREYDLLGKTVLITG